MTGRATHDRTRDHRGTETTEFVVLTTPLHGFAVGASITGLLAELAVLLGAIQRTTGDSLGSITASVARVLTLPRTVADSLASLSETVDRVATYQRSVSDSVDSMTEAVVAVVNP